MKKVNWFLVQVLVLLFGSIYAGYNIYLDFERFYKYHQTFFKFSNTLILNPFLTPCLWGGIMFVVATVIASKVYKYREKNHTKCQNILDKVVLLGVIFAWGNFAYTVVMYCFSLINKTPFVGCSGVNASNPLTTPCFVGALIYTAAFLVTKKLKKQN